MAFDGLPPYSLGEPDVLAFVVIPLLLVALFVWGVATAWRRAGSTTSGIRFATISSAVGAMVWLAFTWGLAAAGVLMQWDRTPPPFMGLVVGMVVLAFSIAFSRVGGRLA